MVGGKMVIELLAGKMRRGRIVAVEDDMRQTYTVKHIRKGPTLFMKMAKALGCNSCVGSVRHSRPTT